MQNKKRDLSIDMCRSLAIILMVSANMAVIAEGNVAWLFRFTSSLAAPMFILLANMMVVLGHLKGKSIASSWSRCLFLFVIAMVCDFSNSVLPGINVDILYFMGLSLVLTTILVRFSIPVLFILSMAVLALASYFQYSFGYRTTMLYALSFDNIQQLSLHFVDEIARRYFIDGWFPLFPWLSIGIFGLILGKLRYPKLGEKAVSFATKQHVLAASVLSLAGVILWSIFPGQQEIVHHYIELFYPPAAGFMVLVMGLCYLTLCFFDYKSYRIFGSIIGPIGESSLFMYILHLALITYILLPLGKVTFGLRYVFYFMLLITVMIGIGHLLKQVRQQVWYKKTSSSVRWLFGEALYFSPKLSEA